MKIKNIAIVGGTHGNEFTGVYLIKQLRLEQFSQKWKGLSIKLLIGNPKAYKKSVRFVDNDLNRAFRKVDLADDSLAGYEAKRAKIIHQKIGSKQEAKTDLIIDLHTTTANMGVSIILVNDNAFNFKMAAYIQSKVANCYIYFVSKETYSAGDDHPFLNSLAPYGFLLEVGPIPNSVVRQDILEQTKSAIDSAFEYIDMVNSGTEPDIAVSVQAFKHRKSVEFPRDADGNINAIVHQHIQDNDYRPIKKGDPVFITLEGDEIVFDQDETLYPVFINEAAYYSTDMAFTLTEKVTVELK